MTEYAHPKCYASALGGCSTKVSGEHYFSKSILEQIHLKPIVESAVHKGSSDGRYGISSLIANVLCTKHNSELSALDNGASRMYRALHGFEDDAKARAGGVAKINSLRKEAEMLSVMFGGASMPLGWGLYMAVPGRPVGAPASFGVEPRTNPETGELMQLVAWLQAIEFWLCLGIPSPVQQEQYRPGGLRLSEAGTERQLELRLTWPPDGTSHATFDVTRIGQMNGWDSREH